MDHFDPAESEPNRLIEYVRSHGSSRLLLRGGSASKIQRELRRRRRGFRPHVLRQRAQRNRRAERTSAPPD